MTNIETKSFDSANYLDSAETIVAYLNAHLEDSSLQELREALATVTRSRGIISHLARRSNVSGLRARLDGNSNIQNDPLRF